jgi:hypothetical protein
MLQINLNMVITIARLGTNVPKYIEKVDTPSGHNYKQNYTF